MLDLDRGNQLALQGIVGIEQKYQVWLKTAMVQSDSGRIKRYQRVLQDLNPENPVMGELERLQSEAVERTLKETKRKEAAAATRLAEEEQQRQAVAAQKPAISPDPVTSTADSRSPTVSNTNRVTDISEGAEEVKQATKQNQPVSDLPELVAKIAPGTTNQALPKVAAIDPNRPYDGYYWGQMRCSGTIGLGKSIPFSRYVSLTISGDQVELKGDYRVGSGTQKGKIALKKGMFSKPGQIRIAGSAYYSNRSVKANYSYKGSFDTDVIELTGPRGKRNCTFKVSRVKKYAPPQ